MWFNIPLFPERAATLANQVDYLYFFLILNTVFFTLVVAVGVGYFAMRYRRAEDPQRQQKTPPRFLQRFPGPHPPPFPLPLGRPGGGGWLVYTPAPGRPDAQP